MGTNESQINHIYGSEDAQGILQRAIDFYGYKVRIHVWGDRALEKCFSFHHRTPVTARVAKGQKIGLFSRRAVSQASSHQGHQSIGFSACFRR